MFRLNFKSLAIAIQDLTIRYFFDFFEILKLDSTKFNKFFVMKIKNKTKFLRVSVLALSCEAQIRNTHLSYNKIFY